MNARIKRAAQIVIGFALAGVLLWVFFRKTDWDGAASATEQAGVWLLVLAVACNVASLLIRNYRWQILLRPLGNKVTFVPSFRAYIVGFAVTGALPGRLGELLRPYLLSRSESIPFPSVLATVLVERVIDLLAVLILLSTAFLIPDALGPSGQEQALPIVRGAAMGALAVALGVGCFLVFLRLRTELAKKVVAFFCRPLPHKISTKIVGLTQAFADGLGGMRKPQHLFGLLATTTVTWLVLAVGSYAGLAAFGLPVPFHRVLFLLAVLALGVVVPTPGGAGAYHAGVMLVVGELWGLADGYGPTVAAFAIVSHLVAFGPILFLGAGALIWGGIDIRSAAAEASKLKQE